jgi:hypothetical protein
MRWLRALWAAAAVAAAAVLSSWAGHLGTATWWRLALELGLGVTACVLATVVMGAAVPDTDGWVAWLALWPAVILVAATVTLTAVDIEVRTGRWEAVVVQDAKCVSTEGGCAWSYRVSDARTERDLGWIPCDDDTLRPGATTRVRADPAGRHQPDLEPCAYTSPAWTVGLRIVDVLWGLAVVGVFAGALRMID